MSLQVIKSTTGEPEYILLPIRVYEQCRQHIDQALNEADSEYEDFVLEDYVSNPVALARINAKLSQQALADLMGVTQAYISKIENQVIVSHKVMSKVTAAIFSICNTSFE
jgi:ribosome-binding protein aMBF1 (putative translation factor)